MFNSYSDIPEKSGAIFKFLENQGYEVSDEELWYEARQYEDMPHFGNLLLSMSEIRMTGALSHYLNKESFIDKTIDEFYKIASTGESSDYLIQLIEYGKENIDDFREMLKEIIKENNKNFDFEPFVKFEINATASHFSIFDKEIYELENIHDAVLDMATEGDITEKYFIELRDKFNEIGLSVDFDEKDQLIIENKNKNKLKI